MWGGARLLYDFPMPRKDAFAFVSFEHTPSPAHHEQPPTSLTGNVSALPSRPSRLSTCPVHDSSLAVRPLSYKALKSKRPSGLR